MVRWFREKKENIVQKLRSRRKEGASLVSVVIGTMFLLAIGLTVITVATKYVVTVIVDRNSTDNFYNAEGILAEVRVGLLEQAGTSGKSAYKDILENYTSSKKNMKDEFSKKYLAGIATYLLSTGSYTYDDKSSDTTKHFDAKLGVLQDCGSHSVDKVKNLSKKPDSVTTTSSDGDLHFVINYEPAIGYSLTLKDIKIDYHEDPNYASTVNTDIVFTVPDYKFEGDSTFDELKDYIVISDDALKIDFANSGASFSGNIYTGQTDSGIHINSQSKVDFFSPKIISRGSLDILTGATVNVSGASGAGDLYLQNLRLKQSGSGSPLSTTLNVNENAYISNDLDIQDSNSVVTLKGKYYGYSYNEQNDSSNPGANSDYSSAILINGLNTTLNAADLNKMVLAGRSFVDQKNSQNNSVNSDIMMGESMSVKSNQLAYLVPEEYITPQDSQQNPIITNEPYAVNTAGLLNDLGAYLNTSKPYIENYHPAGFTYLFLNFKDEVSANKYFKDYYSGAVTVKDETGAVVDTTEQLSEKAKTYLVSTDLTNMKFSANLYLIAGNIVYNYEATGGSNGLQTANYYDSTTQKPAAELLADGKKMALNYLGNCLTLLPSGSSGRDANIRLDASDSPLVSGVIIDYSKLTADITKDVTTSVEPNAKIWVKKGDYTVGTKASGLIIADGDVTVQADFTGLILTNGKVTVNGNYTLKADMVMLGEILEQIRTDPAFEQIAKLFRALNGTSKQNATDLEKCVYYQNWERNK